MPQIAYEDPSNLCHGGLGPLQMTGALLWLLREHFADPDRIAAATLRRNPWSADIRNGIVIDSVTNWNPKLVEARPAVYVKRNTWTPQSLGIANKRMGGSPVDGSRSYAVLIVGSHTLFCIAGAPDEVEVLGAEVWSEFLQFSDQIRDHLNLTRFTVGEIGQVSKLKEAKNNYAVAVPVMYALVLDWEVFKHSPKLKRIVMTTGQAP